VYTVSELSTLLKKQLESSFGSIKVVGQVSGLTLASSGHAYFSLKDDQAVLAAVMFRSALARLPHSVLKEGEQIECLGRLTYYEPRGRIQLVVEYIVPQGAGALELKFLKLKAELQAEGLFESAKKRPLPKMPETIGVVTSPTGAAIRDILKVLRRRFPGVSVLLCPARVQGEGAAEEIAAAIELIGDEKYADVLIVGRGGGSIEDLWAFNEEIVVRAVAASKIPVISAVGHEVDIVLSDLAADVRAATPSAAAEMVVPDRSELLRSLEQKKDSLRQAISLKLALCRRELSDRARRIRDPRFVLASHRLRIDEARRSAEASINRRLEIERRRLSGSQVGLVGQVPQKRLALQRSRLSRAKANLIHLIENGLNSRKVALQSHRQTINNLSPLAVLERGYSIVTTKQQELVRDASQLSVGDSIDVRLHRGSIAGTVEKIKE
jgi:exodeoxyribonuclease VII large subunit